MAAKTNKLAHPLRRFGAVPLARCVLDEVLSDYRRPNDKVSEWLREKALLPLRRGLYVTGPELRSAPVCLALVANHLYGPSYVSLDYALAWHGLIPEAVVEVTSVTPKPSRRYDNAVGRFSFSHLPLHFYAIGQEMGETAEGLFYLIASPAKALCDRLVLTRNLGPLSREAMKAWLFEDLRLDPDLAAELNLEVVRTCLASGYKHRQLGTLLKVLEDHQMEWGEE